MTEDLNRESRDAASGDDTASEDTAGEDTAGEDTAGEDTAGEDRRLWEWRAFWPRDEAGAGSPGWPGAVEAGWPLDLLWPGETAKLKREQDSDRYFLIPGQDINFKLRGTKLSRKPVLARDGGLIHSGAKDKIKLPASLADIEMLLPAGTLPRTLPEDLDRMAAIAEPDRLAAVLCRAIPGTESVAVAKARLTLTVKDKAAGTRDGIELGRIEVAGRRFVTLCIESRSRGRIEARLARLGEAAAAPPRDYPEFLRAILGRAESGAAGAAEAAGAGAAGAGMASR